MSNVLSRTLESPVRPVVVPLALDPLTANIAVQAGFEHVYVSGGALGYSYGVSEALLTVTENQVERVTFELLARLPMASATTSITIAAAFLFIVTSVVSAAFVLGTFSSRGDPDPPVRIRVIWGIVLGVFGAAMVASGSIEAVRGFIALGALPFVFITGLIVVCFLRALKEEPHADR